MTPKYWGFTGDGVQTDFPIAGADVADPVFYDVMLDRLGQDPADDYTIILGDDLADSVIRFAMPPPDLEEGWVVLRGYARAFSLGDPITLSILLDYLRIRDRHRGRYRVRSHRHRPRARPGHRDQRRAR